MFWRSLEEICEVKVPHASSSFYGKHSFYGKRKSVYVSIPLFVVLESAECLNKITEIQVKTSMYLFYLLLTNYCFNMPFTNRLKVPVLST